MFSKEGKFGAYAMKRIAASAHLPTSWLFEPAKRLEYSVNSALFELPRTRRKFELCENRLSRCFIQSGQIIIWWIRSSDNSRCADPSYAELLYYPCSLHERGGLTDVSQSIGCQRLDDGTDIRIGTTEEARFVREEMIHENELKHKKWQVLLRLEWIWKSDNQREKRKTCHL